LNLCRNTFPAEAFKKKKRFSKEIIKIYRYEQEEQENANHRSSSRIGDHRRLFPLHRQVAENEALPQYSEGDTYYTVEHGNCHR
jgi:hypothetical protein